MIKKVIQISDIHIRLYQRQEEYKEQFQKFYKELDKLRKEISFEEGRIIFTGDLFHQKITISNESIIITSSFLKEISKRFRVILLPGNHDALIKNKDRLDSITPVVELLDNENIWYFKESGCYKDLYDENIVYSIWSCLDNQKNPILNKYKEKYDPNNEKIYITLYHGPVKGCKTDQNYTFTDGIDIQEFTGSDLICLGDIHLKQKLELEEDNKIIPAIYSGSFIAQNHGESNEKGFVLWDIKDKNKITYSFVEIPNDYGFYTIEINNFDNLYNNPKEQNLKISKKPNLRIIWSDKELNYSGIKVNEIKSYYQNKYNPISLIVIFESTDISNLINVEKSQINNINNPEIQRKLMIDFLLESGQLNDEELEIEIES